MKIEKVSENQIKCTLNREDLASRHLRISELAYGTDKARELFQDMMQQAQYELGFEAENLPLMIEAIPVSGECLILLVTKVENPEELDTRFSNFTPLSAQGAPEAIEPEQPIYADEILNCFDHLEKLLNKLGSEDNKAKAKKQGVPISDSKQLPDIQQALTKIYRFQSFQRLHSLAMMLSPIYSGENHLYLEQSTGHYYLLVRMSHHTPEEFNKICNILSEYGVPARTTYATSAYFEEHMRLLISKDAITQLSKL